jgi:hypothetical protein
MSDYHVTPRPDGDWNVQRAGGDKPSRVESTQAGAYDVARGLADRSGGGEVRVHRPTGQIRNSNTIGKTDPNPPRDRRH